MKNIRILVTILLLTFSSLNNNVYSSNPDSLTRNEITNIYNNVRILKYNDSTNKELIKLQTDQIRQYKSLAGQDSIIIAGQKFENGLLNTAIKDCKDIYERDRLKPWHIYVSAAAGFLSSVIIYTLIK